MSPILPAVFECTAISRKHRDLPGLENRSPFRRRPKEWLDGRATNRVNGGRPLEAGLYLYRAELPRFGKILLLTALVRRVCRRLAVCCQGNINDPGPLVAADGVVPSARRAALTLRSANRVRGATLVEAFAPLAPALPPPGARPLACFLFAGT